MKRKSTKRDKKEIDELLRKAKSGKWTAQEKVRLAHLLDPDSKPYLTIVEK